MDYTDPADAPKRQLSPQEVEQLKADYQLEVLSKFQSFLDTSSGFSVKVSGFRMPKDAGNN